MFHTASPGPGNGPAMHLALLTLQIRRDSPCERTLMPNSHLARCFGGMFGGIWLSRSDDIEQYQAIVSYSRFPSPPEIQGFQRKSCRKCSVVPAFTRRRVRVWSESARLRSFTPTRNRPINGCSRGATLGWNWQDAPGVTFIMPGSDKRLEPCSIGPFVPCVQQLGVRPCP